jgi:hypothetical protein
MCVHTALIQAKCAFCLTAHLCVLCDSHEQHRLFVYTIKSSVFIIDTNCVLYERELKYYVRFN